MGVHGLWQLLNCTGQAVPLETLDGKVLAVDVSVWLHQLSKGMRDSQGNPLPYAHLHGLFTRICKLLYYRIKPVFVFDGGVPLLKKETLAARRGKRDDAEKESERTQRKILSNLIRSEVVKQSLGLDAIPKALSTSKPGGKQDALFHLPPLPETSEMHPSASQTSDPVDSFEERRELQLLIEQSYGDITKIDIQSEDFLNLPTDIQHEIIFDMKERRKNYNLSRIADMPDNSKDFSNFQVAKLLKQSKLSTRLVEVRKELNTGIATDWRKQYGKSFQGGEIQSQRVISDDASHFILVKGLRRNSQEQSGSKDVIVSDDSGSNTDELLHENQEERENLNFSKSDQQIPIGKVVIGQIKSGTSQQLIQNSNLIGQSKLNGESKCVSESEHENCAVYRPVIEFETDSDSDDESINASEIEFKPKSIFNKTEESHKFEMDNACIVIDSDDNDLDDNMKDIQANRDLQIAIEESLKDQKAANLASGVHSITNATSSSKDPKSQSDVLIIEPRSPVANKEKTANSEQAQTKDKNLVPVSKSSVDNKNNSHNSALNGTKTSPMKTYKDISDLRKEAHIFKRNISLVSSPEEICVPKKPRQTEEPDEMIDDVVDATDDNGQDGEFIVIAATSAINGDAKEVVINDEELPQVMEINSSGEESSDDDFIEVEVDTKNAKEDELFPASIFETNISVSPSIHSESSSIHGDQVECVEADADANELEHGGSQGDDIESGVEASTGHDDTQSPTSIEDEAESPNLPDIVSSIQSPENRVPDLVRDFQFLNENNIKGMRANLSDESRQLRLEKGRQDRLAMSITDQMHADSQALLRLFGIPYIVSPTEAEAQCAQLELIGLTNGTITDDSDIWLFGGKCVYKNFFNQAKHVECYREVKISSELGLTRQSLISLALLCGSDYTSGIQGVGPVTAMEILAEFPGDGIQGLLQLKSWWEEAQEQIQLPTESKLRSKLRDLDISSGFPNPRVVDAYMEPSVDDSSEPFSWSLPDANQLRQFNTEKLGWSQDKTDEHLLPVLKQMKNKEHQRSISSYFQPEVHIQPAKMKSKRLQKVVTKFLNPDIVDQSETVISADSGAECENRKVKSQDKGRGKSRTKQKNVTVSGGNSNKPNSEIEIDIKNRNDIDNTEGPRSPDSDTGQGQKDENVRSKYFRKNVRSPKRIEENVSRDSSDSKSSSGEDSSSDSSDSSDEDMHVVETGLNVAEILNLKMGDVVSNQSRTNTEVSRIGDSLDANCQEMKDSMTEEHTDNESDVENDHDNFETEGGFMRDSDFDSDFDFELEHQTKKAKLTDDLVTVPDSSDLENIAKLEGKKTIELGTIAKKFLAHIHNSPESKIKDVPTSAIQISKQATSNIESRTSKHLQRLKFGDSKDNRSVETGLISSERPLDYICDLNKSSTKTKQMKKEASSDKVYKSSVKKKHGENSNDSDEPINSCLTKPNTGDPIKTTTNAIPSDNDSKSAKEPIRTSVTKSYTSDPIKPIASGVPWISKTKKKSVAMKRKGRGKGRNLEPVEKVGKKTKKQSTLKNPIGVVNLSESSSDSD